MLKTNEKNLELQARPELLDIIEVVAKDKGVAIEEVFEAMEMAIKKIANSKYGMLYNIRAKINRNNGAIVIHKVLSVVEEVENPYYEITLEQAKQRGDTVELGDEITEVLPTVNFDRGYVQSFRQVITHKVKEAEKEREYQSYKDKIGEIVSGVVRRVEMGNFFVELTNKAEAFLRRDNSIPREILEVGNRIRALVIDVKRDLKASQIFISRTHPDFIAKLFVQEIPEIYEGIIEIKAIARDAGSRTKMAVYSKDPSLEPVGACVGFKGSKIQGVLSEIKGEKIDLIQWSDSIATFVINAFHPSEVLKVIVDESKKVIEIVLKSENLSLAIGRRGQNINLISKLIGWNIDLMGEEAEKEKRQKDTQEKTKYFKEALDVDDVISHLLIIEGFNTVEDIVEADSAALKTIQAFNDDIIEELKSRGKEYLAGQAKKSALELTELGVSKELMNIEKLNNETLLILAKNSIKTMEDLADLSVYDLIDILPKGLINQAEAESLILLARKSWE